MDIKSHRLRHSNFDNNIRNYRVALWYCFNHCGGLLMWSVYKGGQKKSLKAFQKIEEENRKLDLDQMKKDALQEREDKKESE